MHQKENMFDDIVRRELQTLMLQQTITGVCVSIPTWSSVVTIVLCVANVRSAAEEQRLSGLTLLSTNVRLLKVG
jgi:hypothetical protein